MSAMPATGPRPRRRSAALGVLAIIAVAALVGALTGGQAHILAPQHTPSPVARMPGGPPAHIAVIVMENEEFSDIIASHEAPFINRLAAHSALAGQMYAVSHPSLPNYLALTGGSTFGIASDCTGCSVHASNLVTQLQRAGISWRAYMEGIPHPCFAGAGAGRYAKKHDPFMYYTPIASTRALCAHVVGFARLAADERAGSLPRFAWITPDLCHDMHDCDTATGDRFLASTVPALLARLGHHGLLILTWDEGSSDDGCCGLARGGHIVTILAGAGARAGAHMTRATDHYSLLQTIEDLLGLSRLRGAACACTPSLAPLLARG
jgi:phosphatidylinositol-3-phosphatase